MKRYFYLLILLLFPILLHGQDTAVVKKQADLIAQATFRGEYQTIIAYTYSGLIELSGGADSLHAIIAQRMTALKKQGILGLSGSVGSPGKFYTAGNEIHTLLPEEIIIRTAAGKYRSRSYLLGISNDKGESWTFLDVGNMPTEVLHRLLPNFNDNLVIPPPVKPEFLAN